MPKKGAIVLTLITLLAVSACQTSAEGRAESTIPVRETVFDVHNDFVVTPIRAFDVTTQAVVDTGAELSILPPDLSSHIDVDVIGFVDLSIVLHDRELISTPVVRAPIVEWSGLTFRDVLFAVPDRDVWDSVFDGSSVIIGGNLLARNSIEFDFPRRTIRVTQNGFHEDPFLNENYVEQSTIPIVELSINDIRMPALVDTGAVRTSISFQAPSFVGPEVEPVAERLYLYGGVEERESLVPVGSLRWGEIAVRDALVRSVETDYAVIVGMDILSRLSFSISYRVEGPVVTVDPSPVGAFGLASMTSPQFGFTLAPGEDGVFSVVTVIEPSAAYSAGMRPGDRVNAVFPVDSDGPGTPITDPRSIGVFLSENRQAIFEVLKYDTETVATVSISKMPIVLPSVVAP